MVDAKIINGKRYEFSGLECASMNKAKSYQKKLKSNGVNATIITKIQNGHPYYLVYSRDGRNKMPEDFKSVSQLFKQPGKNFKPNPEYHGKKKSISAHPPKKRTTTNRPKKRPSRTRDNWSSLDVRSAILLD